MAASSRQFFEVPTGVILHVFTNELRLTEIGDQDKSYDQIVLDAKDYIDQIKNKEDIHIHFEKDEVIYSMIDISSYHGLGYPSKNSDIYPYFIQIWDYIRTTFAKQKAEALKAKIDILFNDIKSNLETISDILTDQTNLQYRDQFLHNLEISKVASQILSLEADDRYNILVSIGARLRNNYYDKPDEQAWRDELAKFLLHAAASRDAIDKHSIVSQVEGLTGYKKTTYDHKE